MKEVQLKRMWQTDNETIGRLYIEHEPFCFTLEPPWKGNQRQVSCIPAATYDCIWQRSPRFGWTFQIINVPDRTRILIHSGNLARHTYGCVLLGKYKGSLEGENAVLVSRPTLRKFHETVGQKSFRLEVQSCHYLQI